VWVGRAVGAPLGRASRCDGREPSAGRSERPGIRAAGSSVSLLLTTEVIVSTLAGVAGEIGDQDGKVRRIRLRDTRELWCFDTREESHQCK